MIPKIIKGVEIDESENLDYNLFKLRSELLRKSSFKFIYQNALNSAQESSPRGKSGLLLKIILFIILIPYYLFSILATSKRTKAIQEAEEELIQYYENPTTKVRHFRLLCSQEKQIYQQEINELELELQAQKKNLNLKSIGNSTRKEIENLIAAFEDNLIKKQRKLEFYTKCEERLLAIEDQFKIKESIFRSREKLLELSESEDEESRKIEIEKEFEVFDYYGNLLDELSNNLQKVEQDKEEVIEELELKDMLLQIEKLKV